MLWGISLFIGILVLLTGAYFLFSSLERRIFIFEQRLIQRFSSRTDVICQLYEVSRDSLNRHEEIFQEILSLRKKEFTLMCISQSLESFLTLQASIHHEINFIFQVCNKHPKLNREKSFLYVRDVMIEKSSHIGGEMQRYRKIIKSYNTCIHYKNISLLGYILPFSRKPEL